MDIKKIFIYFLSVAYMILGVVILMGKEFFYLSTTLKIIFGLACIAYGLFRAYRNYSISDN
jgi:hypothetical protein